MHAYVFLRLSSIPWVASHASRRWLWVIAACGFASYPLARLLGSWKLPVLASALEFAAATWVGTLFLLLAWFAVADVLTLGGWLFPSWTSAIRGGAALLALGLSAVALVQGLRPPVVRNYELTLPGLPPERDGLRLVQLSDLHLGSLIGPGWLERLVGRVGQLKPDLVVVTGDLVDGHVGRMEPLVPVLQKLKAPLGVWAVTGNHEYYAGLEQSLEFLKRSGFTVLRDECQEAAPGLMLAGVDDLTARAQFGNGRDAVQKALPPGRAGATIFLSHTPWQAEKAAESGAGLMLSGHTHNGQIWPFTYFVQLRYPFISGRYEVAGMTLIVTRGTGTWGPRMRLWRRGEIVAIRLRSPELGRAM